MSVGLVIVSHSREIAAGTAQLAAQMAPSVTVEAAGGLDDGQIGTSFDLIAAGIDAADTGDGAVVLYDLGSALMTAETAVEFLDPDQAERVRIVNAPLVEGAISAAVAAEGGADLDGVDAAARSAAREWVDEDRPPSDAGSPPSTPADMERTVEVINPLGLHARPAAVLARATRSHDATITLARDGEDPVPIVEVLGVVGRAFRGGDTVTVRGAGPDAAIAVDRVVALIQEGFGETGDAPTGSAAASDRAKATRDGDTITATPGSSGRAVGPAYLLGELVPHLPDEDGENPDAEGARLDAAITEAIARLEAEGEFGRAHAALIADPALRAAATEYLADGAAHAWWTAVEAAADTLAASTDELIAARAVDMREAAGAVLTNMGATLDRVPEDAAGSIAVARDLGPAEIPRLVDAGIAGAVLEEGAPTAHAVIVAKGLGFPLVIGVGDTFKDVHSDALLILDGDEGTIRVDPPEEDLAAARSDVADQAARQEDLRRAAQEPVTLAGGRQIRVGANVGSVADARAAIRNGADAVGLLRTELLILDKPVYPDEDTQTADLSEILEVVGERPVTVRVLDAGGDKPVKALDVGPEHNGFLGVRGLRYLLRHPELLHTQLRAIMRASVGHHVSVMAPMVTIPDEARDFREAVEEARQSLEADGTAHAAPEGVGIMVEIPWVPPDAPPASTSTSRCVSTAGPTTRLRRCHRAVPTPTPNLRTGPSGAGRRSL